MIVGLLLIVASSYRQTIQAYPDGGGAYTVAKSNIGGPQTIIASTPFYLGDWEPERM